jgi:hypothetical protein
LIVGVAMLREVVEVTFSLRNLSANQTPMNAPSALEHACHADVKAGRGGGQRREVCERSGGAPIRNSLQNVCRKQDSWRNQ